MRSYHYLSACKTSIPVMRWVGMSDVSMSTVKICEVMDTSPPFLYKSCLYAYDEQHLPVECSAQ